MCSCTSHQGQVDVVLVNILAETAGAGEKPNVVRFSNSGTGSQWYQSL